MAKQQPVTPAPPVKSNLVVRSVATLLAASAIGVTVVWFSHRPLTARQHLQLGDEYKNHGRGAMAVQEYEAAAALDKRAAAPYLAMADLEQKAGNLGTAADRLGTVLYYHPNYPHIQCRRAQLYGMSNRFETAWTIANDAVRIEPDCAAGHNDLGMLLELAGDVHGAAIQLGKAHVLDPSDEALTLDYARVLAKSGNPDDALNIVDGVLPVTREFKVQANYLEGWILAEYGRNGVRGRKLENDAQIYLGHALAINHDHTASLAESGRIFLHQKLYSAAQDQLERAFKKGPDTIEMLQDMTALYREEHSPKLDSAMSTCNQFNDLILPLKKYRLIYTQHPHNQENNIKLAQSEMKAGNVSDAWDLVEEALKKDPQNSAATRLYTQMKSPLAAAK